MGFPPTSVCVISWMIATILFCSFLFLKKSVQNVMVFEFVSTKAWNTWHEGFLSGVSHAVGGVRGDFLLHQREDALDFLHDRRLGGREAPLQHRAHDLCRGVLRLRLEGAQAIEGLRDPTGAPAMTGSKFLVWRSPQCGGSSMSLASFRVSLK